MRTQVPDIPITPTWSRILAIWLAVSDPLAAHKKSSKAECTSDEVWNSFLFFFKKKKKKLSKTVWSESLASNLPKKKKKKEKGKG